MRAANKQARCWHVKARVVSYASAWFVGLDKHMNWEQYSQLRAAPVRAPGLVRVRACLVPPMPPVRPCASMHDQAGEETGDGRLRWLQPSNHSTLLGHKALIDTPDSSSSWGVYVLRFKRRRKMSLENYYYREGHLPFEVVISYDFESLQICDC
jgi:hypothetical protein